MDLTANKAVALILLGVIKLLSGLAPLVLTKLLKKKSDRFLKKFIGVTLCFGGGVLLATVLLHMLKEVREVLEGAFAKGALPESLEEYPFAELMVGAGFLLILLIESAVHKFFGGGHGHSHFPSQETLARRFVAVEDVRGGVDNVGYDTESQGVPHVYSVTQPGPNYGTTSDSDSTPPASPEHRAEKDRRADILGSLRSILVVIALSVHSLFEGMAIGLDTNASGVWMLTAAIAIHAVPIVFCVGTDMLTSGVKKMKLIVYMIILSLNTPIGILIGIIVTLHKESEDSGSHVLAIGVLQGLAAGTLLYITFFEVLARDKLTKYGMSGLAGALAVILGFAFMGGMEAAPGLSHSHSHDMGHGHAHDMGHHDVHDMDHHHEALSEAEGHLHMAHQQYSHGGHDHREEHDHDHEEHDDHDDHDHDHDHDEHEEHDHDHDEHEEHDHDHEDHEEHDHDHEDHEEHDHDHEDHEEHDHDHEDHEEHDEHDHDHDHDHEDSHQHEGEHSHEGHDHEDHDHEHHDDDDDIDTDLLQVKSDDYFELNGTDYKFMHDM